MPGKDKYSSLLKKFENYGHKFIGNCDIDFLNFRHCQVRNFEILNLYKWNQILESSFESTESKAESQLSTLILYQRLVVYHWNFM